MKREDVVWLIKSGGRILGPYSYNNLEDLLRKKELHVIDEVAQPMRRWGLIRDHLIFRDMIERLRQEDATIDDGTTTSGAGTSSLTESVHGAMHADEITEDISEYQSQLKEIIYENVTESQRPTARPTPQGRFQAADQVDERMIREEAERGSRWMWVLTVFVLVSIGGVWGAKRFLNAPAKVEARDLVIDGLNLFEDGDFATSLEILKKAYNASPGRKDIWFPLATMLVQIEGQTVEAKRLLQKVIDEKVEAPAAAWTAMALAHMTDGDNSAAQDSLTKALASDASFLPAKANRGSLALIKKDYASARQLLAQVYNGGMRRGEILLQLVAAQVYSEKSSGEKSGRDALSETTKAVRNYLLGDADFQQELRLSEVYLNYLRNDLSQSEYDAQFRRIIDIDPQQTDDFHHPILTAKVMASWTHTGAWCRQLSEAGGEMPTAIALGAVCLFKQGQFLQAKAAIEKAINQAPRDPLLQAVYASILRAAGFGGEASVALGRSIELDRRGEYLLPVLLQARFCQEKDDWDCANTFWMKVLQIDPKLPSAKIGLAEIYWAKQSKGETQRLMQDVANSAPNYRPYLRMKRVVESKNAP